MYGRRERSEYREVEVNRWFSLRTGTRSRTISILDRFNAEREQTAMKNASVIGNCAVIGMSSIIRHRFRDFDLSSISSSNLIFRVSSVEAKSKVCLFSLSLSLSFNFLSSRKNVASSVKDRKPWIDFVIFLYDHEGRMTKGG